MLDRNMQFELARQLLGFAMLAIAQCNMANEKCSFCCYCLQILYFQMQRMTTERHVAAARACFQF